MATGFRWLLALSMLVGLMSFALDRRSEYYGQKYEMQSGSRFVEAVCSVESRGPCFRKLLLASIGDAIVAGVFSSVFLFVLGGLFVLLVLGLLGGGSVLSTVMAPVNGELRDDRAFFVQPDSLGDQPNNRVKTDRAAPGRVREER